MNPFVITGRYVAPEYFCDREKETAELLSNVENWRNTVLISLRRMGKSGLISHLYHHPQVVAKYETFFIDIYDTCSVEDFVLLLGKEIVSRLQPKGERLVEKFVRTVTSLRLVLGTDILTGLPSFNIEAGEIKDPVKTMEQIFSFLESSERPCVVAVDEFQQIADYPDGKKVIARLRTLVQSCRQTRFIFAGSNRRMMSDLFNSPSEPFFMSCTPIHLEPIDRERYADFVCGHFRAAGKVVNPECVEYVYELFDGHTWFIQYVFNRLYEMTEKGSAVTIEKAHEAVRFILDLFEPSFQELFARMSERQRSLLTAIAKSGSVSSPTGVDFISRYGLRSASAVQGALRPLIKDETVSYVNGHYLISNRFFSYWLAGRY